MRFLSASLALAAATLALTSASAQTAPSDPLHIWIQAKDPAAAEAWVNQRLDEEKTGIEKLLAVSGPRTVENTLRPFDEAENALTLAGNNAYLLYSLADAAPLRDQAQALSAKIASAATDLSLDPRVYAALAAVPLPANDPPTRHYLERALLEYRIAGVDKDDATRKQIRAVSERITALTLAFGRNVADGTLKVKATRAELDGLPEDYIARHQPDADGAYTLTTDEPDAKPVMSFATSAALRLRMFVAYSSRAYPQNTQVLKDMLAARQQLASLLGFNHFADLATADMMIGSPAHVEELIDQVDNASRPAAAREFAELLAFARTKQPGITSIRFADQSYWREQYRRSRYDFDAQSVRPYFPYTAVQQGILTTAARLFHISFQPVKDAAVWDSAVDTFDVIDAAPGSAGKRLGRIYLDMHPRAGKDKWFSAGPVVPGIRGRELPEGMLICNFPGGTAGDPGLMQYNDVVTFFHEFGHLMHYILGSQGEWSQQGSFNVESDFLEAPSQMLEEMFHDPAILQSFGKHYQTGEVLPASLIARMNAAGAYGRASDLQWFLQFSSYGLQLHDQDPAGLDFDALWTADTRRFSSFTPVEGIHYYASFVHLEGYASNLYTYLLDKVIAVDFFAQFDKQNLLDGPTAMRYRRTVLEPGASKPAAELVRGFLGRPQNLDALKAWMNQEFDPPVDSRQP
ncbi:MAG TPA: M3 family metallopeptidase [Terracidiphilus sp.]|nr:M3 family metallopeptidase [Terracidiphilus sp.]